MKVNYKERLIKKADKKLGGYDLSQYEWLMVAEYLDTNYKNNRSGFVDYISDLFFKKHKITLEEYQNLFDLA